jgi:signal transduction histidine kinase
VVAAGPGLPRGARVGVVELFHRVAGDATPGSGLGLSIAKAIAERHGGAIALGDARPGQSPPGLEATVLLPAA